MTSISGAEPANHNLRVFLVDDNHTFLRAAVNFMEHQMNFEVVGTAQSAKEAFEKIKQIQPDVILLDLDMPEMNGLAATPFIRRIAPRTKIIILTLLDSSNDRIAAILAGADGFVSKSAMFNELMPTVTQSLSSPTGSSA